MYDNIMNDVFCIFKNKFSKTCNFVEKYVAFFVLAFVVVAGIYLRLKLLCSNQPFGFDECALASNIIAKNYIEFFRPLDFYQVAPPMFLVVEKFMYECFSENFSTEFSLRIFPCLCSILSLIVIPLFVHKIYKNICVTSGVAFMTAFTILVVNYANEVKQYSCELFVASVLMMFFYFFDVEKYSKTKLFCASLIISIAPLFSTSSFFVIAIGSLIVLWNIYDRKKSISYAIFYLFPIFICTVLYAVFFYKPIHDKLYVFMSNYWIITNPSMFTFENFGSMVLPKLEFLMKEFCGIDYFHWKLFFLCNFALFLFYKNRKLIFLCLGILALTIFAGFINSYPFEARLILFLFPILAIIYMQAFLFIKNKYVSTFVAITLFVSTICCLKNPVSDYVVHNTVISDVFQKLKEINPELKNVIGTKSCLVCFDGNDVVYDLDIWKDFDKDNFEKLLSDLPKDTYYIYLPYRRMSSSYNRELKDYLINSNNKLKIVNFYAFGEDDKQFVVEIINTIGE